MELLNSTYFNNTLLNWLIALGSILAAMLILKLAKSIIVKKFTPAPDASAPPNEFTSGVADIIGRTRTFFIIIIAVFIGIRVLTLPEKVSNFIYTAAMIALFIQMGLWADTAVKNWTSKSILRKHNDDPTISTVINLISFMVRFAFWVIIVILALDNLGFNITTLIAGVGVGGLAISLAAQNILKDLFASVSIVLDKPFIVGDFISIGEFSGTVENIGLKTTRIRSVNGEQIIFSNTDLLESRLRNFKRMTERRILFTISVVYQTTREQLEKIPQIIRETIEAQEQTRFDRSHFKGYAASSLDFETVYFVTAPDYSIYMDIQQKINLELFSAFAREGIQFAHPTTTMIIAKEENSEIKPDKKDDLFS